MKKVVLTTLLSLAAISSSSALAQGNLPLIIGYEADATSLDPGQVTDINSMQVLSQIYEGLVVIGKTGKIEPRLASKWTISPDRLNYTFDLFPGRKFASGQAVNADAVVFSFMRQLDKANPGNKFGPFPFAPFYYESLSKVEKLGDLKVRFTLKKPDSAFLAGLTVPTSFIVDQKAALAAGKGFATSGGGSGPFMLDSWQRGGQLALKRNPNYPKPAASAKLVWVPLVQSNQRATALQSGTVDIVINPAAENLSALQGAGYRVATGAGPHIWWVGLNLTRPPFNNKLVRQAVSYAIDRQGIVKGILYNTGVVASQPLASMQPGFNSTVMQYTYDPAKAKELLKQAGYPNGFSTTLFVPTSGSGMQNPVAMGTAIQAYLSQIGIKVNIQQLDWGTYLAKIGDGAKKSNLDMWELSWMNVAVDPAFVLDPNFSSKALPPGINTGYYINAQTERLMTQARAEAAPKKRDALYQQAEAQIAADAPWIFVDNAKQVVAYNKSVTGFELHPIAPFLLQLKDVKK